MRHSLLIVICSFVLLGNLYAQHGVRGFRGASWNGPFAVIVDFRDNMAGGTYEVRGPGGFEYVGPGATGNQYAVSGNETWYNAFPADGSRPYLAWRRTSGDTNQFNPNTGTNWGAWQGEPNFIPAPVVDEEYDFSYVFGAEYGGSVVTLFAADGTVLASYTIPIGGTVLEAGVSAPSLEGAYWDVDGIFAGSIDDPTAAPNTSTARPGYDFGFAPSFEGGEWKAERGDGLVVGGGSIVPGTSDVGRVTIGQGDEVTVWTRVPAGDGMGAAWVPSPVSLPAANTTTSYFFTSSSSPTNAPAPVPTPTPVPIPTPAPAPGVVTTNVTTNNLAADEVVTLDVPEADVPDPDFGAVELVEEAQGVFGKVAEGYENFAEAFTTGALTFNEFKNLYLPPPGLNCTFEMGPVSINLSSMLPAWVRGGSKIVFLLAALGAMMRMLWEAFA